MKQNQTDSTVKPKPIQVAVYVTAQRKKQIRIEAVRADKTMSDWVSDLIDQYFENTENNKDNLI